MLYFIDASRPFTIYNLSSMEIYLQLVKGDPLPLLEFLSCLGIGAGCLVAAIEVSRDELFVRGMHPVWVELDFR